MGERHRIIFCHALNYVRQIKAVWKCCVAAAAPARVRRKLFRNRGRALFSELVLRSSRMNRAKHPVSNAKPYSHRIKPLSDASEIGEVLRRAFCSRRTFIGEDSSKHLMKKWLRRRRAGGASVAANGA